MKRGDGGLASPTIHSAFLPDPVAPTFFTSTLVLILLVYVEDASLLFLSATGISICSRPFPIACSPYHR